MTSNDSTEDLTELFNQISLYQESNDNMAQAQPNAELVNLQL